MECVELQVVGPWIRFTNTISEIKKGNPLHLKFTVSSFLKALNSRILSIPPQIKLAAKHKQCKKKRKTTSGWLHSAYTSFILPLLFLFIAPQLPGYKISKFLEFFPKCKSDFLFILQLFTSAFKNIEYKINVE